MKRLLFLVCGLSLALSAHAQIAFETGTWAEVKAKAKKQNKMIFVDAYTTWCGPCKWMSKNTFTDKSVGDYYNANFINYKFDMEKGDGIKFAEDFAVEAYPTLLYLSPTAEIARRFEGSQAASEFIENGKEVQGGGSPDKPEEPTEIEWSDLNEKAWHCYEQESDKAKLAEAITWALQSIEMNKNFYNTDTYAHLLYKTGKKREALKWANVALALGKSVNENTESTAELIKLIKNGN